jgi:hypothetical protein
MNEDTNKMIFKMNISDYFSLLQGEIYIDGDITISMVLCDYLFIFTREKKIFILDELTYNNYRPSINEITMMLQIFDPLESILTLKSLDGISYISLMLSDFGYDNVQNNNSKIIKTNMVDFLKKFNDKINTISSEINKCQKLLDLLKNEDFQKKINICKDKHFNKNPNKIKAKKMSNCWLHNRK